jgi:phosphoribosyl-ATP pyrophosphohydrolase
VSGSGPDSEPEAESDADSNADAGTGTEADSDTDPGADPDADPIVDELFAVIEQRKRDLPEDSYTASLFTHEKGENAILEKLGEETTEVLLAAKDGDREAVARESADLVYHLLVLLAANDVDLADLRAELRERR